MMAADIITRKSIWNTISNPAVSQIERKYGQELVQESQIDTEIFEFNSFNDEKYQTQVKTNSGFEQIEFEGLEFPEGFEYNDRVIPPKKVTPVKFKITKKYKAKPVLNKDEWADFFDVE